MNGIYLLLGSNLGNRLEYLREAEHLLIQKGIQVIDESTIYETKPWGKENQGWFLNVVLQIETSKRPEELLETILGIEKELGRVRKEKWGERSIDIDILYFHDEVLDTEALKIPHPGISNRRFTLIPLAEMCPLELHPITKQSQMQMLADCTDELDCKPTDYKL
ncbi:MAG: 2-amino-4-hydroxy-6-hydroxymethyldihydropteridine diphosphokinase [Ekhidna sp.]|uniref:2-amino-4-hydroxy-6- hydroxymethyldihydropteridine diphosphokinase n=1 Tax=Ekhidna sp. TaxID=2608089 RepID=UPI0032EABBBC